MPSRIDDFWLPDDANQDMMGADWYQYSDWHQYAINVLYNGLRDVADLDHLPWHVGNQLTLVGFTPRGVWRPMPDIAVYPTAGPEFRQEMSVEKDGAPTLVVEIASPSTWEYDVNDVSGKTIGYLGTGVEYYLVFDPTNELMGTPCRSWRRVGGATRTWRPEGDGSYYCSSLGIALRPEGIIPRVLDQDGQPVPTREERLEQLASQTRQLTAQADEISALRAEIVPLRSGRHDLA